MSDKSEGFNLTLECGASVHVNSVEVNQEDAETLDIDFSFDENIDIPEEIIKEEVSNKIIEILSKYADSIIENVEKLENTEK